MQQYFRDSRKSTHILQQFTDDKPFAATQITNPGGKNFPIIELPAEI